MKVDTPDCRLNRLGTSSDEFHQWLAERFDLHPNQITQRKMQLLERAGDVFSGGDPRSGELAAVDINVPHAKIGQLVLKNDFLSGALGRLPGSSAKR
jgi:transposase